MGTSLSSQKSLPEVDLSGKTAIVTGANTGIGYETAKTLAQQGAKVILACRSEGKAKEAIERMKKEHSEEKVDVKKARIKIKADDLDVEFVALDLASLTSTMTFVDAFKAKGRPLHILICNAGMAFAQKGTTEDGFEIHFQVNYLSHFLLILHLLPVLKASGVNARVILVSSMAYRGASWKEGDLQSINRDQMMKYNTTKVYQIMQMYSLSRRLEGSGIGVFSLHPGLVNSEFAQRDNQDMPGSMRFSAGLAKTLKLTRNCFDGALTTLHAAVDPVYDGKTAIYLENSKPSRLGTSLPRNKEKQEILWKYTMDCLKDYITEETLKELSSA